MNDYHSRDQIARSIGKDRSKSLADNDCIHVIDINTNKGSSSF